MISDLDEIPNLKNLDFNDINNKIIIFQQKMFYYKLNYFMITLYGMEQKHKKKDLIPQWLNMLKILVWRF